MKKDLFRREISLLLAPHIPAGSPARQEPLLRSGCSLGRGCGRSASVRSVWRWLALCMTFSLALGCTGCSGAGGSAGGGMGASAASMFLRKTEGTVAVADAGGADVAPAENLGLYSGYTVGTGEKSYAWIDLDKVKLTKLDENSAAEITKDGKNLSIEVTSGSLFFSVTEPLADDETMEISTSSMLVGIRGTCGWVTQNSAALLEGTVTVTAGEESVTITAGEQVWLMRDGTFLVQELTFDSIPDFVAQELLVDDALQQTVLDASGLRIPTTYEEVMNIWEQERPELGIVYSEEIDFERDGSPEFLTVYAGETDSGMSAIGINIYRNETEGIRKLTGRSMALMSEGERCCALMESNGRYFICICHKGQQSHADYIGSLAERDGGPGDWGVVDSFTGWDEFDPYAPEFVSAMPHDERGFIVSTAGGTDWEAVDAQGRYTLVRGLYATTPAS